MIPVQTEAKKAASPAPPSFAPVPSPVLMVQDPRGLSQQAQASLLSAEHQKPGQQQSPLRAADAAAQVSLCFTQALLFSTRPCCLCCVVCCLGLSGACDGLPAKCTCACNSHHLGVVCHVASQDLNDSWTLQLP